MTTDKLHHGKLILVQYVRSLRIPSPKTYTHVHITTFQITICSGVIMQHFTPLLLISKQLRAAMNY